MTFVQRHAYGFGAGFAALLWPFFPRRRRLSVANIIKCGIASDESEARRIAKNIRKLKKARTVPMIRMMRKTLFFILSLPL